MEQIILIISITGILIHTFLPYFLRSVSPAGILNYNESHGGRCGGEFRIHWFINTRFMSVRKNIANTSGLYFITFTCCKWLPLFELVNAYDEIYKQFDTLKSEGHHIVGYVLMPNHVHALIAFKKMKTSVNQRIGTVKRFLAYQLIKRMKERGQTSILQMLHAAVNNTENQSGKLHVVFEPSFDCKECYGKKMIDQKLNYIHINPCKGKWQLAGSPVDYVHSSAKFYITGEPGFYPVTNYMTLEDIDLTR